MKGSTNVLHIVQSGYVQVTILQLIRVLSFTKNLLLTPLYRVYTLLIYKGLYSSEQSLYINMNVCTTLFRAYTWNMNVCTTLYRTYTWIWMFVHFCTERIPGYLMSLQLCTELKPGFEYLVQSVYLAVSQGAAAGRTSSTSSSQRLVIALLSRMPIEEY